jgi:hypothetical protein
MPTVTELCAPVMKLFSSVMELCAPVMALWAALTRPFGGFHGSV